MEEEEEEEEERLLSELRVRWCAAHFLRPSVRPCFSNNKRRPPPSLPSINNTPSLLSLFLLSQSKGEAVAPLLTYPKIPIAQPKKGGGTVGRGRERGGRGRGSKDRDRGSSFFFLWLDPQKGSLSVQTAWRH